MRLKPSVELLVAVLLVCAAFPTFAQTAPAATKDSLPLSIGAGLSVFDPSYPISGKGQMLGGTLWVDYTPNWMPRHLHGLGIEAEAGHINDNLDRAPHYKVRIDYAGGGVDYHWFHFNRFTPYVKFVYGFGNIDYLPAADVPYHQNRTITAPGGGVDIRVAGRIKVRGDYEYQTWPDFFKAYNPSGSLNPQGFTVGVLYQLGSPRIIFR